MNKLKYIIILGFLICFVGCKTTKYVEVPVEKIHTEYKTDSIYIHDKSEKTDSIIYKDSIVTIITDSIVYVDRWHSLILKNSSTKQDTIYKNKLVYITDSIDKPVYITKEVIVNKLYWWLKDLMWLGGVVLLLLISYFGFKIFKLIKK